MIDNPGVGVALTIEPTSGTFVHSTAAPGSWTDLDLGPTIGAKPSLVMLKILAPSANHTYAFRKNGDTHEFFDDLQSIGITLISNVDVTVYTVVWLPTDANGVIEWKCINNVGNTLVKLMAYIN